MIINDQYHRCVSDGLKLVYSGSFNRKFAQQI